MARVAAAGDVAAGERKAEKCAVCHGPDGSSTTALIPSLAGQQVLYLSLQLVQYREHRRKDPQMTPYAEKLTDEDVEDLAAYYASQKPFASRRPTDPARVAAGRKVSEANHCGSCHVPDLAGQKHIPRLVGQRYDYLLKEMRAFKAQTRADIDGSMTTAAEPLSTQDVEDVVEYVASLPTGVREAGAR